MMSGEVGKQLPLSWGTNTYLSIAFNIGKFNISPEKAPSVFFKKPICYNIFSYNLSP